MKVRSIHSKDKIQWISTTATTNTTNTTLFFTVYINNNKSKIRAIFIFVVFLLKMDTKYSINGLYEIHVRRSTKKVAYYVKARMVKKDIELVVL